MTPRKVLALGDEPGVLHLEHEDGVLRLRVPFDVFRGAEVGASVDVPDDLSSPIASAMGFFRLELP